MSMQIRHPEVTTMPAPVSSSAALPGLAGMLFASSVQTGVKGAAATSSATSFSTTLQSRLDGRPPAREPGAHLDGAERPREPERSPERAREPERQNAGAPRDGAANGKADGAQEGRPADGKGAHRETSGAHGEGTPASQAGGKAAEGAAAASAAGGTDPITLAAPAAVVLTDAAADADGGTDDTGIDADLPAELAALLPQLAAARMAEGAPRPGPAADDSPGKSLQNSGLLPRMDAGLPGAGRGAADPALMLQARENAAAGRLAAGVKGADGAGAALASTLPGDAVPHPAGEFAALRNQAIAARPATPQLPVNTPVGRDGWVDEVGNRVTWMLGRAESKAELVLTPPNLGKLEVSINLNGDQTTAQFVASSQAARNALEQALPRLREMFAEAGISLGEASVGTSGEQQAGRDGGSGGRGRGGGTLGNGTAATAWSRQHDGMVDTFV
ncbi:flagellar hook-length control protein [Thauera sinica]|nr:flagellar hook-length control protein [Thauera sp. K11]